MKDIVVIYHGDCPDGFGGAWAAWKKFGDNADYFAILHDDEPLADLKDKDIYFIDIVYKKPGLVELKKINKKIVIIDHHHKTSELLDLADDSLFTNEHSGAVLSWQYFHSDKTTPRLLSYLEERDLWRWVTDESRAILAYVGTFGYDFEVWDDIVNKLESDVVAREEFKKNGQLLLSQWFSICDDLLKHDSFLAEFEGHTVHVINAPSMFADDLGNRLIKKSLSVALIWHQNKEGVVSVSLRSDESVDVSELARKHGGGGHKRSSAFRILAGQPFPWKMIN